MAAAYLSRMRMLAYFSRLRMCRFYTYANSYTYDFISFHTTYAYARMKMWQIRCGHYIIEKVWKFNIYTVIIKLIFLECCWICGSWCFFQFFYKYLYFIKYNISCDWSSQHECNTYNCFKDRKLCMNYTKLKQI
jgi:hypothetical protein